jgi:CRISPR-associated endonuclease Cas1
MAPTGNVSQLSSSGKSPFSRTGVLTIHGFGVRVRMQSGHLEIEDGVGPERRKIRFARVRHGLRRLVIIGSDGFVTFEALRWLTDQNAAFVMLERNGRVLATIGPVSPSDVRLRRAQSLAHTSGIALKIARELIEQKLVGQQRVLRQFFGDTNAHEVISDSRRLAARAKSNEEILRWEARGAHVYWNTMHDLPVSFSKADSTKIPEHWKSFGSRVSPLTNSPRLAVSPAQAILNYLYAILESESRLALAALGLDPGIGVLHNDLRSRDSLACDLMEPVRPKVDELLLQLLTTGQLRREWFFEQRDGNCRLMAPFAATLSETAMMWRKEVASFAEWIAKCFWDAQIRPIRQDIPATRLTQRRKSESRAKLLNRNDDENTLRRPAMCKMCSHISMLIDGTCDNCASAKSRPRNP